ncbi:hypothetical protein PUN28_014104 [Cardiocondyla obscurior]
MKTEKKPNEPSCCPPTTVVKDEPDADPVKIKEEGSGGNEDATGEDTSECPRDPCLDPSNGEGTMSGENQSANGNQPILNSVKQEGDPNNPSDDLPDYSGNVITADSIQPLVSNVVGKQMGTSTSSGEAQYMQQQSQIFVFSTTLANKAADTVLRGEYSSIIAYHCAQPGTKKYLEKHPNKVNQFRQNPAQWLNNLAMMKQKGHQGNANNTFPTEQPPDLPALDPNAPQFWNEQPNLRNINGGNSLGNSEPSLDDGNIDVPCLVPNSPGNSANPQPANNATMGHSPNLLGGTTSPGPGGLQPSLQGVKVPDENLTPKQRQHREVQLATLRKMQMILFPGHKEDQSGNALTDATQGTTVSCPPTNVPPVGVPNQCSPSMDWHKLQHQFLDGKNKATVGNPGAVPLRGSNMVGVPRSQGPPPPYHQTTRSASVPIAIQSPNPSSPNNPTSNLSLPSPRASSALNSPADCNRQFQLGNQRTSHLPGQSPTSQDSPNPTVATAATAAVSTTRLNHSNPGTPVSHSHIAALSPSGTTAQKDASLDFSTNQQPNVDGMFCRTLQSLAQQKQQHAGNVNASAVKEANLMPVPSPHQLQYLSTFEGQELTIQKQPNTSLKDGNSSTNTGNSSEMPNRILPGSLDSNNQFPNRSEGASPVQMDSINRGFAGSLHSPHTPHTPHTPGSAAPHTPADPAKQGNKSSASAQSSPTPHNSSLPDSMGPPRTVPASPTMKPDTSPPSVKDVQQQQQQTQSQQQQQQQQQQPPQQPSTVVNPNNSGNTTVVPSLSGGPTGAGSFPCGRPSINVSQPSDNVPLNPNNIGGRLGGLNTMGTNFDPITSLAQMSQQLTNTAASNSLGNEPMHSGNAAGMMPFGNPHPGMHMMQMGGEMNGSCHMGAASGEPGNEVGGMCIGLAGPPTSYSPTTSHTGSPGGVPSKMGHPAMMGGHGIMGGHSGVGAAGAGYPGGDPGHAPPPRLIPGHGVAGPSPYNGANVQVKPNAPNTIQYLPARPNVGHAPRGPPSLDFLQRFTNPLSNLESKMGGTPSVNLQYFPNGCVPNSMGGPHSGMPSNMNAAGIPGMGTSPRMDNQSMNTSGTMHPSMRPVGNMRPQPNLMRMQHMVGGGVFPGGSMDSDKVFPPDMVSQNLSNQPNPGMYGVSGNKASPMGLGPPPDATQPLPPSMGGASSNFKTGPFVGSGPSMSDPNYAQQFHNFQQQLYATGTRGSGPPHPNLHPPPNSHSHQQFFMPK